MSEPAIRFAVLGEARSGTTLLDTLINSHPDAVCCGEILNDVDIAEGRPIRWPHRLRPFADELDVDWEELRGRDPVAFLTAIGELGDRAGCRAVGFKLLYGHAWERQFVFEWLASIQTFRWIHVVRRNHLRRFLSLCRAQRSGRWTKQAGASGATEPDRMAPIHMDWDECVESFESRRGMEQFARDGLAGSAVLDLEFETMTADVPATAARLLDFLGLPDRPLATSLRRQATDSLRDAIANYDELRARAVGTPWESFFDE